MKGAKVIPSRSLLAAFLLPLALSLATVWRQDVVLPLLLLDCLIFLVAVLDLAATPSGTFTCDVHSRDVLSLGQKCPVRLELSSSLKRPVRVKIRPHIPPEFQSPELSEDVLHLALELSPGRAQSIVYHLIPNERGEFELDKHTLRAASPLGLWEREQPVGASRKVRVYPDLAMIRTYEMLARKHRQYALVRASRLRGGESEFARLRDYTSDDNYRFIDWKATARRRSLTTREYQLESDQNIFLLLDGGRLMTGQVEGRTQFDWALNASLLMAHVATRGGDRVGMMCFDEEVTAFLPPVAGPKATAALVRGTFDLKPRLTDSAYQKGLGFFGTRVKQRALLILFTQLIDKTAVEELAQQLKLLSRTHLPLVILLEDMDLNDMVAGLDGSIPVREELYRRGAAAELVLWKEQAASDLRKTGAHVISTPAAQLNNRLINRYLEIKAQHAL